MFSFASALHHVGARHAASILYRSSKQIVDRSDTVKRFSEAVRKSDNTLYFVKLKASSYNIYDPMDNQLVVVALKGSDGKEEHCVTIWDKWVFDSNFNFALPLNKESLDLCCSAEHSHEQFVSVGEARLCHFYDALDSKPKQQPQTSQRKRKRK